MKSIIITVSAIIAVVIGICMFSPTAKYAVKGQLTKIENAAQLENAIEILEAKNAEMQQKYVELSVGIHTADMQIKAMQANVDSLAQKPETELTRVKRDTYTVGVQKLTAARDKLVNIRGTIKQNIVGHRSNIEILRAKMTYLESLKTVNAYMKDVNISVDFGNGINSLVEAAIAQEEAVTEAMNDMSAITSEMQDL